MGGDTKRGGRKREREGKMKRAKDKCGAIFRQVDFNGRRILITFTEWNYTGCKRARPEVVAWRKRWRFFREEIVGRRTLVSMFVCTKFMKLCPKFSWLVKVYKGCCRFAALLPKLCRNFWKFDRLLTQRGENSRLDKKIFLGVIVTSFRDWVRNSLWD